jgi:CheY-like chemotaxis protein
MTTPQPKMVLVGDDEAVSRAIVQRMVERLGHRTLGVATGAEALDAVERGGVDVVLLRLDMADGPDTARRILSREGRPRLVVATAEGPVSTGDACLERPIRPDALAAALVGPRVVPPLDHEVLESIRDAWTDGHESLVALVDSFFADIDRQVPLLLAAIEVSDHDKAHRIAHALKGSTGAIGASRLADLFRAIDQALRSGEADRARRLLPEVDVERGHARDAFTAALARP